MDPRKTPSLLTIAENYLRAAPRLLMAVAMLFSATGAATAEPNLLVTSQIDHTVKEYDGTTGAFIRNVATGVGDPLDAIIAPDGSVLVTDGQQDSVKRFNRATGAFLGVFANAVTPLGMTISGNTVYVCQGNSPQIIRSFDAVTGADLGNFVPTVGDGNPSPRDVKVANGRLYVAYWNLGTVEMFDLTTRQSLGLLFPPGTGELMTPASIAFGPDGNLYVSYAFFVNRYHPTTGAFLGQFVDTGDRTGQRYAIGIAWGPDNNLYVATQNTAGVQRYNGTTGAFMDDFVAPESGGLAAPFHISFTPFTPVTNRPPDCSNAKADPDRIWPPNHRLVPIDIVGATDPDGDSVTITATAVTQDEPVHKKGSCHTHPDAVIINGKAWVRAERSGSGNGRVYVISFTATDGRGGSSNGSVTVSVPHHRSQGSVKGPKQGAPRRLQLVDDGQNFNSLRR